MLRIGEYEFYPSGDDSYSRAARLNTRLALLGTALWIGFAGLCLLVVRSVCQ